MYKILFCVARNKLEMEAWNYKSNCLLVYLHTNETLYVIHVHYAQYTMYTHMMMWWAYPFKVLLMLICTADLIEISYCTINYILIYKPKYTLDEHYLQYQITKRFFFTDWTNKNFHPTRFWSISNLNLVEMKTFNKIVNCKELFFFTPLQVNCHLNSLLKFT